MNTNAMDPRAVDALALKDICKRILCERRKRGASAEDIERAEKAYRNAGTALYFALEGQWDRYYFKLRVCGYPPLTDAERAWVPMRPNREPIRKPQAITPATGALKADGGTATAIAWESGRAFNAPTVIEKFKKRFERAYR